MRIYFSALFIVVTVLFQVPLAYAATEITGTVTAKRGDSVQVTFEPHETAGPKVGDAVSFSKEIPGTGGIKAKAGEGTVTEIDGATVWVKTSDNRPNLKMDAVIQATGTIARALPQTSPKGGFLGISITNPTEEMKRQFHLPVDAQGAFVVDIDHGSAAEKAGVQINDLIVECNREKILNVNDLSLIISALGPGGKALLLILRNGHWLFTAVSLGTNPSDIRADIINELIRLHYISEGTKDVSPETLRQTVDFCGMLEGFAKGHPINEKLLQLLRSIDSK